MANQKESIGNTLKVAFFVCLVCAVIVSTLAVGLRPAQQDNRNLFRQQNILQAAGLYERGMDIRAAFENIERRFVEIETGEYVERSEDFDQRRAARDPEESREVSPDPAGIRRQAKVAEVFLARDETGNINRIILPVHGYGLWSTMYGFLALEPDANTVAGIGFFEHGETPGLGGEIDNPRWQENWVGKKLYDENGEVAIEVIKGSTSPDMTDYEHKIDGLSGATITADGVHDMVRFWVGDRGFGPYLERMRRDEYGDDSWATVVAIEE
ncbi:Na(+)-translocating NADH-quinone reductase subunit C [Wenzhouxiangella sp. AB-CW3]|uniref:Na(+)-translocating NADH-quinone reductase subunit C n=1 Tax=Wenzhouxiangella sp. AB-CW3 TaxID=2771012 RepID=UPI00168A4387|nr:Na(+)-translocating NADH-quinone reductase subunit C [Wenzhouxiangella sp. AB-CW3]QOC21391.1 Na(+)-translocating NADH-quinone reductase subunit C [Wenzhouxiangella sp. AB-CW3]